MDKSALFDEQNTLGRYLRDPDHCAPPVGMDSARVQVYRDLIFNNLSLLLSGTFPVLIRILGNERWRALMRVFLRDHRARTPKFGEIALEFVEFLASQPALSGEAWPPFMVELAHYEWVEMALQQSEAEAFAVSDAGQLMTRALQISPLAWPVAYVWPVQLLGPDYQPQVPPAQPTLLLVRRAEDWSMKFSELSPLAWRLLQRISEFAPLTGREQLQALAQEAGQSASASFMDSGLALLQQMHEDQVIGLVS